MNDEEKKLFDHMKDLVGRMAAQLDTLQGLAQSAGFATADVSENVAELIKEAGEIG